ncbi:hypothetical protein Taro_054764 [Colocasia esculenta]|uniref:Uncharacterized protein n=1 Tax=Colocasia esculenta TaxID=4460 RepID=A0A843XPR6_COLES|nr:hypothetical protein [Colocasia esculenta]
MPRGGRPARGRGGSHFTQGHRLPPPTTAPSISGSHSTQTVRQLVRSDSCPSSSCDGGGIFTSTSTSIHCRLRTDCWRTG